MARSSLLESELGNAVAAGIALLAVTSDQRRGTNLLCRLVAPVAR